MLEIPLSDIQDNSVADLQAADLFRMIEAWKSNLHSQQALSYVANVNQEYDRLVGAVSASNLVQLRLMRSYWAKQLIAELLRIHASTICNSNEFKSLLILLAKIRGLIPSSGADILLAAQTRIGNQESIQLLAELLADFCDPSASREAIMQLNCSSYFLRRLGPPVLPQFRPVRKSRRGFDPTSWLHDEDMTNVEFIDDDPDHVRIRGIELRSGDIGIVELNHPGDGILESFLEQPGLAPHAMLYVTRRIRKTSQKTLFQPSLIEIYEGGWRSIPLTTGLSPSFSWYSQWVRPNSMPSDLGSKLSCALDGMETIAFDFQSRRVPKGGHYLPEFGNPSATCTNLIRIPFERSGIDWLPYDTTSIASGAKLNLEKLGVRIPQGVYTPTNIFRSPAYTKIGLVDNGFPEWSYAQYLVNGRPEHLHTIGGMVSQRQLNLENLPNWRSIGHWRSACESFKVTVAQSNGLLGAMVRSSFGFKKEEIPHSASTTTIAYYLRSEFVSADIIRSVVYPELLRWFDADGSFRLSDLRLEPSLCRLVQESIQNSALEREGWYGAKFALTHANNLG